MTLREQVEALLNVGGLTGSTADVSVCAAIEALVPQFGWDALIDVVAAIIADHPSEMAHTPSTPRDRIRAILSDHRFDALRVDYLQVEAIEHLIPQLGWAAVRDGILGALAEERATDDYETLARVIWGAVLDKREVPADRVIALLYHRLSPESDYGHNLVWSITCNLRGVSYLSEYRPLQDPVVRKEMSAVQNG
jgi:hypothetical protein